MQKHFWRFTLQQLALLFSLLCLLLGLGVRHLRPLYEQRITQRNIRDSERALRDFGIALRNDDPALARDAIARGVDVDIELERGCLSGCIRLGHVQVLECLLDQRSKPIQVLSSDGGARYICAVLESEHPLDVRKAMLELFVQYGIDVHSAAEVQEQMMTVAVRRKDAGLFDMLREYGIPYGPREMVAFDRLAELNAAVAAKPDLLNQRVPPVYRGQDATLLGFALSNGRYEMAQFLVASGAPLNTLEGLGQSPMHMAAKGGNPDCVRLIAEHGGDVNARDDWNDTPLTDSIWLANVDVNVLNALVDLGADVNAQGSGGRTALHLALNYGRYVHLPVLIAAGADPTVEDMKGNTALDYAKECPPKIQLLLSQLIEATPSSVELGSGSAGEVDAAPAGQ